MAAISFSVGVVRGLFQVLFKPRIFHMGIPFTFLTLYFHPWIKEDLSKAEMKQGQLIIQYQPFAIGLIVTFDYVYLSEGLGYTLKALKLACGDKV